MKKLEHFIQKNTGKSISSKIAVTMAGTVGVFLILMGIISAFLTYSTSQNRLLEDVKQLALTASQRVSYEIEAYENVAIAFGLNQQISDPTVSVREKQDILNDWVEKYGMQRGNILDANGDSLFDGNNYSDRDYFQQALAGTPYISTPTVSRVTGELSFLISAPLYSQDGDSIIGVVYFAPDENFLNNIMSSISVSQNSRAYMIDKDGNTIAAADTERVGNENISQQASQDSSLSSLAAIHGQMTRGQTGSETYKDGSSTAVIAFTPVEKGDGWSLGITAPMSDFTRETTLSIIIVIAVVIVALAAAICLALGLAHRIGTPIRLCTERIDLLSQGDLSSPVPVVHAQDETGILAEKTKSIADTLHGIIENERYILGEMSKGNFRAKIENPGIYVGEFQEVRSSIETILQEMNRVLSQIRVSADQVSAGADQVSAGAQSLSQGSTEQASSVEELAASANEISDKIAKNTEDLTTMGNKAQQIGEETADSNQRMQDMLKAMSDINKSSGEVKKIIKTIEDIAFQTNILALNAAVEAARAGAAGKGFAVVADEVRNLASKSANASKDTTSLIEETLQAVERGRQIADDTAASLATVLGNVKGANDMMSSIVSNSQEQAQSISQITQGIDQISSVVQTNSATAQESAAASEELSGQAEMMKEMLSKFKISNE